MAWTALTTGQRWTSNSPAIYVDLYYDHYRSGSSMFYKFAINIQPVTGASYFGYSIVLDFSLDYILKITNTLKANSPSQWASPIYYESGWYEVPYKTQGTTVGSFRLYSSGGRDSTYSYNLTVDPAGSVLGTVSSFNIDSSSGVGSAFSVPCTKYYSSYYDVLTIKIGANTVATRLDYATGNVTFSNAELITANTGIYARMASVMNTTFTFELRTYTDSGLGTQIGVVSTTTAIGYLTSFPPVLDSANVTHLDSNSNTVALTGSNTKFIQGYSTLQITVSAKATAQNGAILGNNAYIFEVPGETTQYANESDSLDFVKSFTTITTDTYTLKVIDSRGQQLTIPKTLTNWTTYSIPFISAFSVTRQNGSDADILLSCSGTYTDWAGLSTSNSIQTAKYRYREVGGAYGAQAAITLSTNTAGNFARTSYNPVDLDVSKSYEFELEIIDQLGTSLATSIVPSGTPTLGLDIGNKLLGVGKIPNSSLVTGSIDALGSLYVGGKSLLDLTYPVGAIYISVVSTTPDSLFGGTWSAWGTGRVPVGIDTGQAEFNTVEETGGSNTQTLSEANLPSHRHTGAYWNGTRVSLNDGASAGYHLSWASNATADEENWQTGYTGSGTAHNNLQPYITCYMWKRTA
jgi:hypothetical protein